MKKIFQYFFLLCGLVLSGKGILFLLNTQSDIAILGGLLLIALTIKFSISFINYIHKSKTQQNEEQN